eukprot:COSAG02_NODE_1877_length_10559_cov_8.819025_10_plen_88_part_00
MYSETLKSKQNLTPRLTHTLQRFVITSRRQQCVRTHPEGDESVASLGLIPSFRRVGSVRIRRARAAREPARAAPAVRFVRPHARIRM